MATVPVSTDAQDEPLVLVVDDDPDVLGSLRLHLRAEGYAVLIAASVAEAKRLLNEQLPHAAILDLMLPDGSGLDVARELRQFAEVPVIVLTAVDDEDSKIARLRELADDYVTKPFSTRELSARLASVLRRAWPAGHPSSGMIRLSNGAEVDFSRRRVVQGGLVVHLTPTESRLLWLLMSHAGQVLATETLLARVWPAGEGTPPGLWEYIRRLRDKLGDSSTQPRYIVTEREVGYRFAPEATRR